MVPPPSVVVVVVVVLEVCPQANGATTASAMLSRVFFIVILPLVFPRAGRTLPPLTRDGSDVSPDKYFSDRNPGLVVPAFRFAKIQRGRRDARQAKKMLGNRLRRLTSGPPRGAAL